MNQGIAFPRSLRALRADDFRASKLGLLAAALVLAAWTWWLFAARVPQYESTTNVRMEPGRAIAYFPSASLAQVHIGQPALIHGETGTVPARVNSMASGHVELAWSANGQSLTAASVDIQISRVSPASIALQSLGRHR